jgi:hypothetical protein
MNADYLTSRTSKFVHKTQSRQFLSFRYYEVCVKLLLLSVNYRCGVLRQVNVYITAPTNMSNVLPVILSVQL